MLNEIFLATSSVKQSDEDHKIHAQSLMFIVYLPQSEGSEFLNGMERQQVEEDES